MTKDTFREALVNCQCKKMPRKRCLKMLAGLLALFRRYEKSVAVGHWPCTKSWKMSEKCLQHSEKMILNVDFHIQLSYYSNLKIEYFIPVESLQAHHLYPLVFFVQSGRNRFWCIYAKNCKDFVWHSILRKAWKMHRRLERPEPLPQPTSCHKPADAMLPPMPVTATSRAALWPQAQEAGAAPSSQPL